MGASPQGKLVVGASRSLLDPAFARRPMLRTGYANPLRFFLLL
ncbi:MAG: hypothetical protein RLZZ338_642 [Cyanobacteriota bacterium]|jgi:hypothetical protein